MARASDAASLEPLAIARVQRRTVWVLSIGQILGGLAFGATISLGAVLASVVSGDEAFSGLATAAVTLGTAAFAVPLAAFARRRGRRPPLTTGMAIALIGVLLVVVATGFSSFPLLLVAFGLVGAGQAANLQSRFAAADLATDATRGRDLSLVVWATTIGAVLGPNLVGPGQALGDALGMPSLTGPYVFTVVAQCLAIALYLVWLRPDPLRLAQRVTTSAAGSAARAIAKPDRPIVARYAIFAVAAAHGVMVSMMAMTPVHLLHHGASLTIIGLTISLHIAGMYALAPVFGILADRLGRIPTILVGQALLTAALVTASFGQASNGSRHGRARAAGPGLERDDGGRLDAADRGLVRGAAHPAPGSQRPHDEPRRRRSARSSPGVVLAWIGYGGLALVVGVAVIGTVALSPIARTSETIAGGSRPD